MSSTDKTVASVPEPSEVNLALSFLAVVAASDIAVAIVLYLNMHGTGATRNGLEEHMRSLGFGDDHFVDSEVGVQLRKLHETGFVEARNGCCINTSGRIVVDALLTSSQVNTMEMRLRDFQKSQPIV